MKESFAQLPHPTSLQKVNKVTKVTVIVSDPKFMCLMNREAKPSETSVFRAEKGVLQGLCKEMGGSYPSVPQTP